MSVNAKDLEPGDIMCVGGQIGEFVRLSGKEVVYRPFGCSSTRGRTPRASTYAQMYPIVRVERNKDWVEVRP